MRIIFFAETGASLPYLNLNLLAGFPFSKKSLSLLTEVKTYMKAVILAGGKGTRMGDLTQETPKPMLPIGEKTLLEHQIDLLKKFNITSVIILVNHVKKSIIQHFGNGKKFGVDIEYFEEPEPLGTVGGIKEIELKLQEPFLVLYGDVMINMDLGRLLTFHGKTASECTLVLHPNDHPFDSDLVEMDESGRIINFFPKPHAKDALLPNMVNAGVYIFTPSIFPFLEKGVKADFGRDIFPTVYHQIKMFGYNTAEYLKDMGTPERFKEVTHDYKTGKISRASYDHKQKAIFLDRDGVINEEISFISRPEDMRLYDFTAAAIKKINNSTYKAIVVTNQSVIARNLCTFEELRQIHNKMDSDLGRKRAKIDALYFCPHHPDRGFPEERSEYKVECLCRKPQPGMLLDAAYDFNIDLSSSFMIGDSDRDILAGKSAGCTTVGVRTGYGLRTSSVQPDYFFGNLQEAVTFIIDNPYKALIDQLIKLGSKSPCIILIGGNARSGKSTLASDIGHELKKRNQTALKIELDNWIVPENKRIDCADVYDRFRLRDIETDIQMILSGIQVNMDTYANHPDRKPQSVRYKYTGQDFVLIEGVVALSSEILRDLGQFKIFVDIESAEHKRRIMEYYQWRNKPEEEIESLYSDRTSDEYRLIEKERKFADFVVNSNRT
jgi:histidinol-phosphate phosphatase family protein